MFFVFLDVSGGKGSHTQDFMCRDKSTWAVHADLLVDVSGGRANFQALGFPRVGCARPTH
jgi:hypothetical protein